MPIIQCDKCKKRLNAKDEWIGKKLKCPGCGQQFLAKAGPAGAAPASQAMGSRSVAPPRSGAPAKGAALTSKERALQKKTGPVEKYKGTGISVNWGFVGLIAALLLVVGVICWWVFGPMANNRKWTEKYDQARQDVEDVVQRALAIEMSEGSPMPDPELYRRGGPPTPPSPAVKNVDLYFDAFQWGMPESAEIKGSTTNGKLSGLYFIETGEIEADVELDGSSLAADIEMIPGAVDDATAKRIAKRVGATTSIKVKGRIVNGNPEVEINGVKKDLAEIERKKTEEMLKRRAERHAAENNPAGQESPPAEGMKEGDAPDGGEAAPKPPEDPAANPDAQGKPEVDLLDAGAPGK